MFFHCSPINCYFSITELKNGQLLFMQPLPDPHGQKQICTHKAAHIPAKAQHPSGQEHKSNDQQYHISETAKYCEYYRSSLFHGHDLVGPCQCRHFNSKKQTSQCHEQHIRARKKKKHQYLYQMQRINCYRAHNTQKQR